MSHPQNDTAHRTTVRMANVILRTLQEKDTVELVDLTTAEPPFTMAEIIEFGDDAYAMAAGKQSGPMPIDAVLAADRARRLPPVPAHLWPDEPSDGPAPTDDVGLSAKPCWYAQATAALSEPEFYPLIVKTIDGAVWDFDADRIKDLNTRGHCAEELCKHVAASGIKWLMGRIAPHVRQPRQPNSRHWSRVMLAVDHIVWVETREIEGASRPTDDVGYERRDKALRHSRLKAQ